MSYQEKIVRALILYFYNWWRINANRIQFNDAIREYKLLIEDLEKGNASDAVKNEILERSVIRILLMRGKLHE